LSCSKKTGITPALPTASIAAKLSSQKPSRSTPELIIIDQDYSLMAKANPYSQVLSQIERGAGLYVLSQQNGWYEVETVSKQYGFIKEN